MTGHDPGPSSQQHPGQQGADKSVPQPDPGGRDAELPAELTGITDEDHRREIGGSIGKRRQPGAHVPPAQHKSVDVRGVFPAVNAYRDHHAKEQKQHCDLDNHNSSPLIFKNIRVCFTPETLKCFNALRFKP